MIDWIDSVFGTYTPVMTDIYTSDGAIVGQQVASGMAGVDWRYISAVLIFVTFLYCLFRIIGSLFSRS